MNPFGLPPDCWEFLSSVKQLTFDARQCEAGPVQLRQSEELKLERLPVEASFSSLRNEDPLLNEKGTYNEYGFYYVLSVPLSKGERVSYSILLWLPVEGCFATYEESHHDLLLFPRATWSHIVGNPLLYSNAHWELDFEERNSDFAQELKPWLAHPFRVWGWQLKPLENNRKVDL